MKITKILGLIIAILWSALPATAQDGYLVRTGDKLSIEVLQDRELNRTTTVLPDGRFSFPLAGTVRARGRTISQIQAAVSTAIAGNFQSPPDVFVSVEPAPIEPREPREEPAPEMVMIYFVGEVGSPGTKEVLEGTTFLQALASSGGFTNFAATKRIQLRRTSATSGMQSVYEINYDELANGAQMRNDVPLHDGDVILVPERRLFE